MEAKLTLVAGVATPSRALSSPTRKIERTAHRAGPGAFAECDLYLVTQEQLRAAARIRVVSDFLADTLAQNRALIEGKTS